MNGHGTRDSGAARGRRAVRVWLALAALAAAGALAAAAIHFRRGAPPPELPAVPIPIAAEFVGSEACAGCHRTEYAAWRGSQHARAMQRATRESVRGDFAGKSFT